MYCKQAFLIMHAENLTIKGRRFFLLPFAVQTVSIAAYGNISGKTIKHNYRHTTRYMPSKLNLPYLLYICLSFRKNPSAYLSPGPVPKSLQTRCTINAPKQPFSICLLQHTASLSYVQLIWNHLSRLIFQEYDSLLASWSNRQQRQ